MAPAAPEVRVLFLGLLFFFSVGDMSTVSVEEAAESLDDRRTVRPACNSSGSVLLPLDDLPDRLRLVRLALGDFLGLPLDGNGAR